MKKTSKFLLLATIIVIVALIIITLYRSDTKTVEKITTTKKKKKNEPLKLLPPQEIKAVNDNGTVMIDWEEPPGAKSYILYYSNEPDFSPETARTIGSITGSEFVISKVPEGKYFCYMTSISGARESGPSPLVEFNVEICTPPPAPENFTFKILENSIASGVKVLLSWKTELTLDGYAIHVTSDMIPSGDNFDTHVIFIDDPVTGNYIIENLDPNLKWYAAIASIAAHCGEGHMSKALQLN
jgi:hypothetical protein